MKNKETNNVEKTVYSTVGGFVILTLAPSFIPYCLCFGGLLISLYGIVDVINKSDAVSSFDIKGYIDDMKK